MRNRYAGICYRCGTKVEAGMGFFEKKPHSRPAEWRVQHVTCCHQARDKRVMDRKVKT